jgi:hypothetical protein
VKRTVTSDVIRQGAHTCGVIGHRAHPTKRFFFKAVEQRNSRSTNMP